MNEEEKKQEMQDNIGKEDFWHSNFEIDPQSPDHNQMGPSYA